MTTDTFVKLEAADHRYLGTECSILVTAIMMAGYGEAKTARGCRAAIVKGLTTAFDDCDVFQRQGWYSDVLVIGSESAPYEWAIKVSAYIRNDRFYAEPESGSVLAVYPI
jgi:hypothetical protein